MGSEMCIRDSNWLHDRYAQHPKPNATGFTIDMPGMPKPMQLASRSICPASKTQCNWLHDRHDRHARPNATGFTIDMPGMPNPMQLASRSTCPACQTHCNWLHDRHARHAKPNATSFTIGMPGMPNPMQLASRSACPACQTGRADRRVTSNDPRNNCGTLFGSSPLLVTKVANGKAYLPEISVCNTNLRWRLKLKNEYR